MEKLIAVTGNSGKTVFSYYFAQVLAKQKKKVLIVSTDSLQPACKMLFPTRKLEPNRSLGNLLSLAAVTKADIFNNSNVIDDDLLLYSYAPGESHLTYPAITTTNLHNVFHKFYAIADYVVVDTSTARNVIDQYVLSKNPVQLCITTADEKGFHYRDYYKSENGSVIPILFNNSVYNPLSDILATFSTTVKHILPYSKSLTSVYNGVNISDITAPRRYRKVLYKVAGEIL